MAKEPQEDLVKFVFVKSPDYRTIAANGVWGGVTALGQLKLDLFIDSSGIPEVIAHNVREDGRIGEEIDRAPSEKIITRELQIGILLHVDVAEIIANWILDRVKEVRGAVGGSK